jgi:NAD(P)-dependent dehydrogenase (short-subunit alcohol dehydrogenase family)
MPPAPTYLMVTPCVAMCARPSVPWAAWIFWSTTPRPSARRTTTIEFPGGVGDRRKTDNPALYNATLGSIPFGRMGHAEEIANVALFLASPFASWQSGQAIAVAGAQGL